MRILVTGASGFIGRNLCAALANIRDGKDRRPRFGALLPLELRELTRSSSADDLALACADCDFVFHLAGVNRPEDSAAFLEVNAGFTARLLTELERQGNSCPVMLASSAQASLTGRFAGSLYGASKLEAERLLEEHARRTGARALVYRLPNVYGKWSRPDYNSAVATFCHNTARGLPLRVDDPATELDLLYIDDLAEELLRALLGDERRIEGVFCEAAPVEHVSLGRIVELLGQFKDARRTLVIPEMGEGSFAKKLYSTYQSFLDPSDFAFSLQTRSDERGSFTELVRTQTGGQMSVNVIRPGKTKGQHWHASKWERFCVVSGEALIRMRRIGEETNGNAYPVAEFRVNGDEPTMVEMVPGYTHSITNLSDTCDLVTLIWANELFDADRPDTYAEEV